MSPNPRHCPVCGCEHLQKNGFKKVAGGRHQIWRCVDHKHRFTGQEKYHRASEEERNLALRMDAEGVGIRAIARLSGRFQRSVVCWMQKVDNAA